MFKNNNNSTAAMPAASKKLSSFSRDKLITEHIPMLTMLAPFLIFFFVFTIIPIFSSIALHNISTFSLILILLTKKLL